MTAPTPAEFWQSLIRARLLDAGAVAALRAEHSALPPAAAGDVSAPAIAAWLVNRGTLSRWQAKQLVTGGPGPLLLGDYRLLERHDRAADTLVFTGRQGPTGRLVTLVVLNAKRCRDPQVWNAIVARAAVATRTTDPMLVRAWSLEQVDGARFVVCEHVAGSSLADEVERLGPLPPDQAGLLAWQVARAVAEIHAHGGTHGGLSLDALCREASPAGSDARQGRVRLQQFPLVYDPHLVPLRIPIRDADAIERLGRRSAFVAPELAAGGVCTASSDVYAIGGVLSALLTGRGPCWSGDAPTTLAAAGTRGPTPLPATVPPEIKGVVERMLDRDPNRRLTNATEAADALARCLVISDPRASSATVSRPPADSAPDPAAFEFTAVADRGRRGGPRSYRRERARRQATWFPWIGIVTALLLVAGATAFVVSRSDESKRQEPVARTPKPAAEPRRPPPADAADEGVADASPVAPPIVAAASPRQVVVDDPSLPWVSPTNGPPPTLAYLPTGAELVLLIRLAEVKADDEGRLFLRSLGPAVESALARLVTLGGGDESAIDLVQAAFQVENGDELVGGYTVSFGEGRLAPADDAARQRAWGPTKPITIAGETVFEGKTLSFWVPQAEEGRVLVIAPTQPAAGSEASPMERMIGEVAPLAADESLAVKAVVPDTLETLVGMLDADRHLTVLAMPQQLLKTGRGVLAGALAPLADPLDAVCGEAIQVAAVSLHFGDACYVEVDAVASADVPAPRLARELAGRIDGLVDEVEGSCAALDPDPYGRVLVLRLPAMLRILAGQVRSGAEGKVAVLNAYLPRHAAHNIALAAELALAQLARTTDRRGGGGTVAVAPAGVLDRLGKRMTLSFARDTLERSLQVLAEEAGVPIEFLGGDLEPEGIMKNRSFSLDERDKTAADILRAILATADPEGRLVYVVKEQDGVERVLITTRTAAESRGDPLPPAYAPQSQP